MAEEDASENAREEITISVKNTFIEAEIVERPGKIRRTQSAPDKVSTPADDKASTLADPASSTRTPVQEEAAAAPRSKASWADTTEEELSKELIDKPEKKVTFERSEDAEAGAHDRQQDQNISSPTRSRSRSQKKPLGPTPKELPAEERTRKRKAYVDDVKQTEGYLNYIKDREAGNRTAIDAPRTPDADEDCSKRAWEAKTKPWRQSLRKWGNVTVSEDKRS